MTTYLHDSVSPTVTSVSSSAANGSYKVGQVIPITVTFSEAVYVTGIPQITLATGGGGNNAVVNYASGSGSTVLTFNYTVALNQTSVDLDYVSTTALVFNTGTIKDLAQNSAALTLPATGSGSSIAGQKALVLDTAPPTITYTSISPSSPGSSRTPTLTMTLSEAATVTLYSDGSCTSAISAGTSLTGGPGQQVTTSS
jgi:hypothetical protein